jgi:excisionase family DNA binding protein
LTDLCEVAMAAEVTESKPKLWLSIEELAERLDLPVDTLWKFRAKGTAPRGVKMGKRVRFHVADIEAWEQERREASA